MDSPAQTSPLDRKKTALALAAALSILGLFLSVSVFFPGMMSPESIDQYADVINGKFARQRAPLMSLLWSLLDPDSPFGILLFQNLIFWGATAILGVLTIRRGGLVAGVVLSMVGYLAPNLSMLGMIWKEAGLGSVMLGGFAAIELYRVCRAPVLLAPPALFLFYGSAMSSGGALAIFPALLYGCHAFAHKALLWKKLAAALVLSVLFFGGAQVLSEKISRQMPDQQRGLLSLFDLAGVATHGGSVEWPPMITQSSDYIAKIKASYTPDGVADLLAALRPPFPFQPSDAQALESSRAAAISFNRMPYLRHRWDFVSHMTGLAVKPAVHGYYHGIAENKLGLVFRSGRWSGFAFRYFEAARDSSLFRTALWLLLATGGCMQLVRRRSERACLPAAILASGLLSFLPAAVNGIMGDFRQVWWTLLAAQIAFILTETALAAPKSVGSTAAR